MRQRTSSTNIRDVGDYKYGMCKTIIGLKRTELDDDVGQWGLRKVYY